LKLPLPVLFWLAADFFGLAVSDQLQFVAGCFFMVNGGRCVLPVFNLRLDYYHNRAFANICLNIMSSRGNSAYNSNISFQYCGATYVGSTRVVDTGSRILLVETIILYGDAIQVPDPESILFAGLIPSLHALFLVTAASASDSAIAYRCD